MVSLDLLLLRADWDLQSGVVISGIGVIQTRAHIPYRMPWENWIVSFGAIALVSADSALGLCGSVGRSERSTLCRGYEDERSADQLPDATALEPGHGVGGNRLPRAHRAFLCSVLLATAADYLHLLLWRGCRDPAVSNDASSSDDCYRTGAIEEHG